MRDDELDDSLLKEMAEEADRYIRSFPWCIDIQDKFFGDGYGGIIALFLFRVSIRGGAEPEWIWVIVGGIPSAYLDTAEDIPSPQDALARYLEGVEDWIATPANERASRRDLPPIDGPPGRKFTEMLETRIATLREHFLPHFRNE